MIRDETIIASIDDLKEGGKQSPALSFMGGPSMGQLHLLKSGTWVVGRSKKSTIIVPDATISREHFKLTISDNEVWIEDLNSTNGTYVNGLRITKHLLKDKDTIQISAKTVISFGYATDLEAQKQLQIYQMANFDAVTQARTKSYFLDQLEQELSHARRKEVPLSLFIFDIDHFKHINDSYGHLAGDYVLKKISELTLKTIRTEDLFARYGGEEFVILMRHTAEQEAINLGERIRHIIAMNDFEFESDHFKVTISGGVSAFKDDLNSAELIKTADEYLYFAKENGRNQIAALSLSLTRQ